MDDDELWGSLPRTPYTEGWPEDKWKEEIEKHPFFMTKAPDPNEELPPLIEGLQQLKYSEEENTPDELAKTYKDDGNFYFKCKKYRDAISHYSAGLKLNCSNELKAQLLNNKSASNYCLENFKSALNDCEDTLKLDSNYKKAKIRKAQCLFHLEKFEKCIETCDDILSQEEADPVIMNLKRDAVQRKKLEDRNTRKNVKKKELENIEENALLNCLEKRKIRLIGNKKLVKLSDLDPDPGLSIRFDRVSLKDGNLFWPVVYNFPELHLNMPINEFDENRKLSVLLNIVSEGMTEYDPEKRFIPGKVRIFFQDLHEKLIEFSIYSTLKDVMSSSRFILPGPIAVFYLLLKDSEFTEKYLATNEHVLLPE